MKARDALSVLKYGGKIYPYDMAGMVGQPHVGNVWYVDANNGSDSSGGKSWTDAFATLKKAYDSATTNNYDVIVVAPNGVSATSETAAITWSKNHITVIGASAPSMFSQRARILAGSSVSPLITISGVGNTFANVQFATFNDNNDLISISGTRNAFLNVHFAGIGNATTGDDTSAECIKITGGENYFGHCVIGLDTVMRSAANRSVYFDDGAARNVFEDCIFVAAVDATTPVFIEAADASAVDRFTLFRRCEFITFSTNEGTAMAEVIKIPASPATHRYILVDCVGVDGAGTLDWDSNNRGDVFANMPAAAASAGGGIATSQ